MKKIVVLIISIIFVLSIALVSFFGLKIRTLERTIYVDKVELLNETRNYYGDEYIIIDFDEIDPDNNQVQLGLIPENNYK